MKTKIILLAALFLLVIPAAFSQYVDIDVQPEFYENDTIMFNYTIYSALDMEIEYVAAIHCPIFPIAPLMIHSISLQAGQPYSSAFVGGKVTENIEPQPCSAVVTIGGLHPESFGRNFSIVTDPSFDFYVFTCLDESCQQKEMFFVKGDDVFIYPEASVEELSYEAVLIDPDNETIEIALPYSFTSKKTGLYGVEAAASKQGYKTMSTKILFEVQEERLDLSDNIAEYKEYIKERERIQKIYEEYGGFPPEEALKPKPRPSIWNYLIPIILLVIFIVAYVTWLLTKKKKQKKKRR